MLRNTKYLLSTQKVGATNRAISATIPRNLTFIKNDFDRSHAAVHGVNAGTSEAVLTPGTHVTRKLKRMQDHDKYLKDRKKSPNAMQQRHLKKKCLFSAHTQKSDSDRYVKNASLPKMDHSYCTL